MTTGARPATRLDIGDLALPMTVPMTVPMTPRTSAQRRRQDLVLDTTLELIEERGPDGFQVRDVVERSGISLGTIYRYFPSKDYLIVEALARWSSGLRGRLAASGRSAAGSSGGDTDAGERVATLLRLIATALERHPNFARAVLWGTVSTDPLVELAQGDFRATFGAALALALTDLDPELAVDVEHVVYALLTEHIIAVSTGRPSVGGTEPQLERGIRVVRAAIAAHVPARQPPTQS